MFVWFGVNVVVIICCLKPNETYHIRNVYTTCIHLISFHFISFHFRDTCEIIQFPSIRIKLVHYVSAVFRAHRTNRTFATADRIEPRKHTNTHRHIHFNEEMQKPRWIRFENIFNLIEIMSECMNMHRIINNTCNF